MSRKLKMIDAFLSLAMSDETKKPFIILSIKIRIKLIIEKYCK